MKTGKEFLGCSGWPGEVYGDRGESGGDAVNDSPGWGVPCFLSAQGHRVNLGMIPSRVRAEEATEFSRDTITLEVKETLSFPGLTASHETSYLKGQGSRTERTMPLAIAVDVTMDR